MIKLDRTYSDYTELDDENYPNGKAVDCTTDESYDGTPIKKELVNDLHGALEAVVAEAEGGIEGVSGQPDNIGASDFKDAIKKLIDTPDNAHAALRGPDAHGATVVPIPGQIITRDDNGRAQVAAPVAADDIANKGWVEGITGLLSNLGTSVKTNLVAALNEVRTAFLGHAASTDNPHSVNKKQLGLEFVENYSLKNIIDKIYPVNSIYLCYDSVDPATRFGGTWVRIKDCFLLAKGDTYPTVGATGGEAAHTLTTAEMPSHSHKLNNGNTASTGTKTTAGFRGVNANTGAMSANAEHNHGEIYTWINNVQYKVGYQARNYPSGNIVSGINIGDGSLPYGLYTSAVNTDHTHNITPSGYLYGSTDSAGSGNAHNNMPPYITVSVWRRTA